MKKLILLFVVVFSILTVTAQNNLIPNADMSQWEAEAALPEGFFVDSLSNSARFFKTSNAKYKGKPTLKMIFNNKNDGSSRYFATPYTKLAPGKYELTFYVKGEGFLRSVNLATRNVSNQNRRSANPKNSSDELLITRPMGSKVEPQVFEDWKKITITYTVTKEDEYSVAFANNNKDSESKKGLWISGISLIKK